MEGKLRVDVEMHGENSIDIDLEDLGCESWEEFNKLDSSDKSKRVQAAVDNHPSQPYYLAEDITIVYT